MTIVSAPADLTASAVCSRLARFRATKTSAEKSRARRIAVARPMPWLAPVMTATVFDMRFFPMLKVRSLFSTRPRMTQFSESQHVPHNPEYQSYPRSAQ